MTTSNTSKQAQHTKSPTPYADEEYTPVDPNAELLKLVQSAHYMWVHSTFGVAQQQDFFRQVEVLFPELNWVEDTP